MGHYCRELERARWSVEIAGSTRHLARDLTDLGIDGRLFEGLTGRSPIG